MRLQITNAKSQSNIGKVIDLNSPAIIDGGQSKYTVIFKGKEHVLRVYLDLESIWTRWMRKEITWHG